MCWARAALWEMREDKGFISTPLREQRVLIWTRINLTSFQGQRKDKIRGVKNKTCSPFEIIKEFEI